MQLSTLKIAWRNLGRNKRRTFLAGSAIALGQLTLVFVNGLMAGSFQDMLRTITGPLVGHAQVHHRDWREERAVDLYIDDLATVRAQLAALPEVASVSPRIYGPALIASGELRDEPADAEPGMMVGIDVATELGRGGLLEAVERDALPGDGAVVVGTILANRLGVAAGELLAVIGQDADGFPVSELFEVRAVIDSQVDVVKTLGVVMSIEDAGQLLAMPDQAHEIVLHGEDFHEAEALAEAVAGVPSLSQMEVLSWREAVPLLAKVIDLKKWFDLIFLAIVFVAAAAGVANTALMSTFERTREFGTLLAIGSRPARIVRMVLIEAVILGLVAVAVGSALGAAVVLVTSHTGIDYAAMGGTEAESVAFAGVSLSYIIYPRLELRHIVLGVCAVTLTSILASLWPAALAARLEPMEAMRA